MRALVTLLMSVGIVNAVAEAQALPVSVESPKVFLESYVARTVQQDFTLRNDSDEPVKLIGTKSANTFVELLSSDPSTAVIAPHSSKNISLQFASRILIGAQRPPFDFFLLSDSGKQLSARGFGLVFIQNVFDLDRPEIDFGVVQSSTPTTKSLKLSSSDMPDIRLDRVLEAPEFLNAKVNEGGTALLVVTKAGAPWGIADGFIKLQTNSSIQPEVWVHYKVDVRGEIVPSQNPVNFSPDNVGQQQEESVRLSRAGGKPVKVRSVSTSGVAFGTRIDECAPVAPDCKLLRIILPAETSTGLIKGLVILKFEGLAQDLPLQVGGFRLAPGQKLKTLDDAATGASSSAKEPLDIGKAIERDYRNSSALPIPEGRGPLLKWSVTHESGVYGYAVYRGETDLGPFVRVSRDTLRAIENGGEQGDYQWRDTSAEPGKSYWYYIAALQNDGHKRKLSDPQKVVAK